jgi:HAD superfamily hydrolase (TIGR01549 family)
MESDPLDLSSVKWLFVDIGGPIINDDRAVLYVFDRLKEILIARGETFTETDFASAQVAVLRAGVTSITSSMLQCLTGSTEHDAEVKSELARELSRMPYDQYKALNPLRHGAKESLELLSQRYNLATLSNNASSMREVLRDYRIDRYFSIIGISEAVGYSKPDPRFFQYVLDEAGCRSDEVMMVGDRLDNDIVPARKMGMYTAWVRVGLHYSDDAGPACELETPDILVRSLGELAMILLAEW